MPGSENAAPEKIYFNNLNFLNKEYKNSFFVIYFHICEKNSKMLRNC